MKSRDELNEFRKLDEAGLNDKVESLKEELMRLRFSHVSGQLEKTAQLHSVKKSIARAKTVIREAQAAS